MKPAGSSAALVLDAIGAEVSIHATLQLRGAFSLHRGPASVLERMLCRQTAWSRKFFVADWMLPRPQSKGSPAENKVCCLRLQILVALLEEELMTINRFEGLAA